MNDQERQTRANFDAATLRDMERACGTNEIRDIVRDGSLQSPSSPIPAKLTTEFQPLSQSSSGFVQPPPVMPPPGIALIDAMCEAQDRRDPMPDQQAQFMEVAQIAMQTLTTQTQLIAALLQQSDRPGPKS
jgi:hypothetical protein